MTSYYIWYFLFLIQLGMKYVKAQITNADLKCEGGQLVQYAHSFECLCPKDHVNITRDKCAKLTDLATSCTADNIGQPCGRFAACTRKGSAESCECVAKYAIPPGGNPKTDCKPDKCEGPQCGDGICTVHDGESFCTCKIGFNHTAAGNKLTKCVNSNEKKQKCELKCMEHGHCVLKEGGYYACECINQKPVGEDGKCTANAFTAFLSPVHVLFILAIYVISLKST